MKTEISDVWLSTALPDDKYEKWVTRDIATRKVFLNFRLKRKMKVKKYESV